MCSDCYIPLRGFFFNLFNGPQGRIMAPSTLVSWCHFLFWCSDLDFCPSRVVSHFEWQFFWPLSHFEAKRGITNLMIKYVNARLVFSNLLCWYDSSIDPKKWFHICCLFFDALWCFMKHVIKIFLIFWLHMLHVIFS